MRFFKYHGLGNDFIVLAPVDPGFRIGAGLTPEVARSLCDRWFGIGGDGVMVVAPPRDTANHLAMDLINSDGSYPEMCGNGIRCAAAHAVDVAGWTANPLLIETPGGVKACHWTRGVDGRVAEVRVAMGRVSFEPAKVPMKTDASDGEPTAVTVAGQTFDGVGVNTGNPHFVVFGPATIETTTTFGPLLERHETFPEKANIEFVSVAGDNHLEVLVWERGCGLTYACGTGATAAAAAAIRTGRADADRPVRVDLRGGTLRIDIDGDEAAMTGPATFVFSGDIAIPGHETS